MKILAIDSSNENFFSLAISDDDNVYFYDEYHDRITKKLFDVFESLTDEIKQVDYFTFNAGPGSYTGIRAAIAAIYGLAIVAKKKIVSANNFELLGYKFLTQETNKKTNNIDIYIKSYDKDFLYNQVLDKNLNNVTKLKKVCISEIINDDQNIIISNILDFGIRFQVSAKDLALFVYYKIRNGIEFHDLQPLTLPLT